MTTSTKPVAMIVGGGSGIGADAAKKMSELGYEVAILSSSGKGEALAIELGGMGFTGSNLVPADLEAFVGATMERFGRIDALINCTGHGPKGPIMDISDEDWHLGMDYYLLNVIRAARLVTPIMLAQGSGSIVNVSTFAVFEPDPDFPTSAVFRAGLASYSKLFADKHAAQGVRMNNVLTDDALLVIAVIGATTALFAALCAVAQHDIKRVLAYSTVSQLGYMFLAIGSGAYVAAIFHVITHAFFKALLFLGSGSVIHGMHDEQDMRKMGALRIAMPITGATFIIGWLAIAGVPPFAGFWSKDEILLAAWEQKNIGPLLWVVGLVTALLTAYYMSRQVILVFFGDQRWDDDVHPHESSWTMTTPLCVLAVAAAAGGAINRPLVKDWLVLEHFLEPIFHHPHHFSSGTATKIALAVISVAAGLIGISIAVLSWMKRRIPTDRLEPEFLENAMYVDSSYARVVGGPGTTGFQKTADFDRRIVDGGVNGLARAVMKLGQLIQPTQSGYMRNYAVGVALGALAILVVLAWGLL